MTLRRDVHRRAHGRAARLGRQRLAQARHHARRAPRSPRVGAREIGAGVDAPRGARSPPSCRTLSYTTIVSGSTNHRSGKPNSSGLRVGHALDEAHPVVADHADRAAEEARQRRALERHRPQRRELRAQDLERVARRANALARARPPPTRTSRAARAKQRARAGADEAEARPTSRRPRPTRTGSSCAPSSSRRNSESGVSMSARISRTTGTQLPRLASSSKDSWDGRSTGGLGRAGAARWVEAQKRRRFGGLPEGLQCRQASSAAAAAARRRARPAGRRASHRRRARGPARSRRRAPSSRSATDIRSAPGSRASDCPRASRRRHSSRSSAGEIERDAAADLIDVVDVGVRRRSDRRPRSPRRRAGSRAPSDSRRRTRARRVAPARLGEALVEVRRVGIEVGVEAPRRAARAETRGRRRSARRTPSSSAS